MARQWMNMKQTAKYLGVSFPTLQTMERDGLKFSVVGSRKFCCPEYCDEYMDTRVKASNKKIVNNILEDMR